MGDLTRLEKRLLVIALALFLVAWILINLRRVFATGETYHSLVITSIVVTMIGFGTIIVYVVLAWQRYYKTTHST
jgi:hypothetical protein